MEKEFNEFDDLIKGKLEEKEFAFNEKNWEKMSGILDTARPVQKNKTIYWIASAVAVAGLITIMALLFTNNTTSQNEPEILAINNTEASKTEPIHENVTSIESNATSKNNQQIEMVTEIDVDASEVKAESKPTAKLNAEKKKSDSNYTANFSKTSSASNKQSTPVNTTPVTENWNNTAVNNESDKNPVETLNLISAETDESESAHTSFDFLATKHISSIQIEENQTEVMLNDLDIRNLKVFDNDYVKLKRHHIILEGGVNNSLGWRVNGKRNGNSLIPIAGINYQFNFNHKSAVLIGVQYNALSNITESNVSFNMTKYGFGSTNEIYTYKITELQYLVAPIKYIHKISKTGFIGAGVNLTYLLNTKNKVDVYTQNDNQQTLTQSYKDKGYGFDVTQKYNAQLALHYTHKFSKQIGMNVELNRNLQNVFTDYSAFSIENTASKPSSIKVSLTYLLFNK